MSTSFPNKLTELALLTKNSHFFMGNLPSPIRSKLFNRYGNEHYKVCVCSMQGYRANMEDCHVVELSFKSHPQYSLFGIFDGHNGRKAAQHLSAHLINKLDALKTLTNNVEIQNIILSMDEEFCCTEDGSNGSTIVFAIVRPTEENKYSIRVFWAGDSRAILINDKCTFSELTKDHRPDNPSERERIEKAKGVIINNRVDSKLAVSRAFGDMNLKNNKSLSWPLQRVTSLTEYITASAVSSDILFLFCDGLVEYLDNAPLIESLYQHLNEYEDPVYGLGYLFDEILDGGSRDNMSAIIIYFGKNASNYGLNGRHKTFLPGPLYMTRNDKKYVDAYLRNAKDFGHCDTPKLRRAAYREDLKFLKKYGLNAFAPQQIQYGKTQNNIIYEIEQCIRQIDMNDENNNNNNNQNINHTGSTQVFESKTPPLSETDDDDDDVLSNTKHNMTAIQRHNSIIVTPSPSPTTNDNGKKRRFSNVLNDEKDIKNDNDNDNNDMLNTFSASKRRKSNIGDVIEIH